MFLTNIFPSAIQPSPSGTVVGVAITIRFTCVAFSVLALVFVQGFLDFGVHQLHEICTLRSLLIRQRPTCIPRILDWGAIFVKTITVMHIVGFKQPSMILA